MSAKFGYNIRTLANNNFLNNFKNFEYTQWEANTNYAIGDKVFNGGYRYIAAIGGTSGDTGPSETTAVIDGDITWIYLETVSDTEAFFGNLYFFIGKLTEWNENSIPTPDISDKNSATIVDDIASLKRILKSDMRLGIKFYPWNQGAIYSQYDPTKNPYEVINNGAIDAYTYPFYCIHNYKIYKCINNNNDNESITAPDGITEPTSVITSSTDGYVWKYMGTITQSDYDFITNDYVPVSYLITDELHLAQWDVQMAATNNGISTYKILGNIGTTNPANYTFKIFKDDIAQEAYNSQVIPPINVIVNNESQISNIFALNPGENFNSNCIALIYSSSAEGAGAYTHPSDYSGSDGKVTLNPTTGAIISITFLNPVQQGLNYNSNAKIIIVGKFKDDAINPIHAEVTPLIQGSSVVSANIVNPGNGYEYARAFVIPGVANNNAIGGAVLDVIMAPKNGHGYNIVKEMGANALIIKCLTSTNELYFKTGDDYAFRQFGIMTDLKKYDNISNASEILYIGPSHPEYDNPASELKKISKHYGDILYLSNFGEVTRKSNQEEKIKVTIVF